MLGLSLLAALALVLMVLRNYPATEDMGFEEVVDHFLEKVGKPEVLLAIIAKTYNVIAWVTKASPGASLAAPVSRLLCIYGFAIPIIAAFSPPLASQRAPDVTLFVAIIALIVNNAFADAISARITLANFSWVQAISEPNSPDVSTARALRSTFRAELRLFTSTIKDALHAVLILSISLAISNYLYCIQVGRCLPHSRSDELLGFLDALLSFPCIIFASYNIAKLLGADGVSAIPGMFMFSLTVALPTGLIIMAGATAFVIYPIRMARHVQGWLRANFPVVGTVFGAILPLAASYMVFSLLGWAWDHAQNIQIMENGACYCQQPSAGLRRTNCTI